MATANKTAELETREIPFVIDFPCGQIETAYQEFGGPRDNAHDILKYVSAYTKRYHVDLSRPIGSIHFAQGTETMSEIGRESLIVYDSRAGMKAEVETPDCKDCHAICAKQGRIFCQRALPQILAAGIANNWSI